MPAIRKVMRPYICPMCGKVQFPKHNYDLGRYYITCHEVNITAPTIEALETSLELMGFELDE